MSIKDTAFHLFSLVGGEAGRDAYLRLEGRDGPAERMLGSDPEALEAFLTDSTTLECFNPLGTTYSYFGEAGQFWCLIPKKRLLVKGDWKTEIGRDGADLSLRAPSGHPNPLRGDTEGAWDSVAADFVLMGDDMVPGDILGLRAMQAAPEHMPTGESATLASAMSALGIGAPCPPTKLKWRL